MVTLDLFHCHTSLTVKIFAKAFYFYKGILLNVRVASPCTSSLLPTACGKRVTIPQGAAHFAWAQTSPLNHHLCGQSHLHFGSIPQESRGCGRYVVFYSDPYAHATESSLQQFQCVGLIILPITREGRECSAEC